MIDLIRVERRDKVTEGDRRGAKHYAWVIRDEADAQLHLLRSRLMHGPTFTTPYLSFTPDTLIRLSTMCPVIR